MMSPQLTFAVSGFHYPVREYRSADVRSTNNNYYINVLVSGLSMRLLSYPDP